MNDVLDQFGFLRPDWKDLVEILLVGWVFYRILLVLAGTRAIQMLLGLFLLVAAYVAARVLNLTLLEYLLRTVFQFGVIAALVVFQPELRNALAHLGQNRLLRFFSRLELKEVADEIVQAVEELSRDKTGAILAVERDVGLGEYVESGTPLQARVSAALLQNIFTPLSLLHDGAAVIRGDEIVAAGVILPLTQFPVPDRTLGTRHRAALGLTDETDALVVVVSEETGRISVAHRGRLQLGVTPDQLREILAAGALPSAPLTAPRILSGAS
ncbi:MAG TPA: diadenylate cyclase CdaA [Longimicrobiaceae bacterium]|nr:diadenylate cyclase CdaA [Longimicrobiaceae bacterium]